MFSKVLSSRLKSYLLLRCVKSCRFPRLKHHCPSAPLESNLTTELPSLMSRSRHCVRRKKHASSSQENGIHKWHKSKKYSATFKAATRARIFCQIERILKYPSWFNEAFFQGVSLQSLPSCLLIQKKQRPSQKWICITTPLRLHRCACQVVAKDRE